jgi:C-terminal processing protease CtpA/Prc
VRGVLDGSPSYAAGVRPGDVLIEIAGTPITGPQVFEKQLGAMKPGSEVELRLVRRGQSRTVRPRIAPRPLLISRVQAGKAQAMRLVRRRTVATMPDPVSWQRIAELERQNAELREEVRRLSERVRRLEEARGKPQQ